MTKRTKLILAILAGLAFIAIVVASVWNTLFSGAPANIQQNNMQTQDEMQYQTYTVYPQSPVSFNATAQLQSDNSYFYDASLGEIETIYVKDGQFVKKGDILYAYFLDKNKYDLEDALREQTKLYNQREELIHQLAQLTGGYYNYRGDLISTYWTTDGKQQYAVIESIGKSNGTSSSTESAGSTDVPTGDGSEEGIKAQIRQVNNQIEEVEIKLIRLKEQQHGQVKAKFSGKVVLDESGKDNASIPLVRIISDEVAVEGTVSEYEFYVLGNDRPVTLFVNAEERYVTGKMVAYDNIPAPTNSGSGNKTESVPAAPPTASEGGTRYRFTIAPDEFIQPGFSVKVQAMMPGYVIPQDALLEENGQFYVFVVRDKVAHKLEVKLERQGVQRVVLQGLNEGDTLLLYPYDVKDGQVVTIAEPADLKEGIQGMPKEQVGE